MLNCVSPRPVSLILPREVAGWTAEASLKYLLALFNHTDLCGVRTIQLACFSWVVGGPNWTPTAFCLYRVTRFHTGHLGLQASSLLFGTASRCTVITKRQQVDQSLCTCDGTWLVGWLKSKHAIKIKNRFHIFLDLVSGFRRVVSEGFALQGC